jgi:hypothetical protein
LCLAVGRFGEGITHLTDLSRSSLGGYGRYTTYSK